MAHRIEPIVRGSPLLGFGGGAYCAHCGYIIEQYPNVGRWYHGKTKIAPSLKEIQDERKRSPRFPGIR